MLTLKYSKVNQAWIIMWNNIVLEIRTTKESMADFLKTETRISSAHIAELLDGKALRHMVA